MTFSSCFWRQWRDGIITRDMDWIKSVNPNGHSVESWMRETDYRGDLKFDLLKNLQDGKLIGMNWERVQKL